MVQSGGRGITWILAIVNPKINLEKRKNVISFRILKIKNKLRGKKNNSEALSFVCEKRSV